MRVKVNRGEIWWADLGEPQGSAPGFRSPVLIIQADYFNRSRINTIICAVITSNIKLAEAPGNIFLSKKESGLSKDSVINISQIITLNKNYLTEIVKKLKPIIMKDVETSLKLIFDID
jgi:mRNA interferase MazF